MTTRFVKGKARTETPRLKDLSVHASERDPTEGRAEGGRFAPGNRVSVGQGWKATIRKSLGALATSPEADDVIRQATSLYIAVLRGLPSDGAGVRQLVAAQCRHAALATFYANEAARAGLASALGLKLAEASRSHDTTAQRLSVSAYDRAVHEAEARPKAHGSALFYETAARIEGK